MVYSICIAMHGFLNFGCNRIAQKTNQLYISHYHIRINLIRSIFFYGCPMVFQHSFPTVFLGFPTMVNGDPVIFLNVCDNPQQVQVFPWWCNTLMVTRQGDVARYPADLSHWNIINVVSNSGWWFGTRVFFHIPSGYLT